MAAIVVPLETRRATRRFAARVADALAPGDLVTLDGPLGAGKTFLTRGVLRALGVPEREPVQSPTFALVHEYDVPRGRVLHVDLYRLRGEPTVRDDLARLGLAEQRREGAIVIAEWADGLVEALGGAPALTLRISPRGAGREAVVGGDKREALAAGA